MNAGRNAAKKIAVLAMLTGLSLIMFLIENLFPTILPGARMGLANIFSLVALIMYSPLEAFAVVVIQRIFVHAIPCNFDYVYFHCGCGSPQHYAKHCVRICIRHRAYLRLYALSRSARHTFGRDSRRRNAAYIPRIAAKSVCKNHSRKKKEFKTY